VLVLVLMLLLLVLMLQQAQRAWTRVACYGQYRATSSDVADDATHSRFHLVPPPRLVRSSMAAWLRNVLGWTCDRCKNLKRRRRCTHPPPSKMVAAPAVAATADDLGVVGGPKAQCTSPVCTRQCRYVFRFGGCTLVLLLLLLRC